MLDQLQGILKQYSAGVAQPAPTEVAVHYDQVATAVPSDTLADGVAHALRSNETPSLGEMVSHLFTQADGTQKAAMLNHMLPAVGMAPTTPDLAQRIKPEQVAQLADQAHAADPSVVDRLSGFYAQHPTLIKGLGASALAIVMSRISRRQV